MSLPALPPESGPWLPPDAVQRLALHQELHARPSARLKLPALLLYVAVLNEGVTREAELAHLQRLPGQSGLGLADLDSSFLRLRLGGHTLRWERHNEFTRYSLVQALPASAQLGASEPNLLGELALPREWLQQIPGRTIVAVLLAMVEHGLEDHSAALAAAQTWFGPCPLVASVLGSGHSIAITDFQLLPSGFERMLVLSEPGTSPLRAGRLSQRLLELETYRVMALLGLPVAKGLAGMLSDCEQGLAAVTAAMQGSAPGSEEQRLDDLIRLAAKVEHATAAHGYRFSATQAYDGLVQQRIHDLRESALSGTQTLGSFMQRRLSPAIATVNSTARRLDALAQRIERSSALLRTRVDIASEAQQHQLLGQLTRGQALQLSLQTTVEGLSIAAISYYVVSLLAYAGKALKSLGLPLNTELATGCLIPLVLWGVWRGTRRIHARLHRQDEGARRT